MNIILFGQKNAAKTTLGKALSLHLKRDFLDTDKEIEKFYFQKNQNELSYKEIFKKYGQTYFRELEKEVIFSIQNQDLIVSVGGGALLDANTRNHISTLGHLFYLTIPFDLYLQRALEDPFFENKDPSFLKKNFLKRQTIFESLMATKLDGKESLTNLINEVLLGIE
jgi:shikimate kinase